MRIEPSTKTPQRLAARAFTVVESVFAVAVTAMAFGVIAHGYATSGRNTEWSGYTLAAQALTTARLEQTRAARWDPSVTPPVDELGAIGVNEQTVLLDVPGTTNKVRATVRTTVSQLSTNPALRMISVQCIWPFLNGQVFTNEDATYRAPDA